MFLLTFAVVPAQAQVTGAWELSVESPRGAQTLMLVLAMDGDEVIGTLSRQGTSGGGGGRSSSGRGGPPELTLNDVSIDGSVFSFSVTLSMPGAQQFTGSVNGDEMSGKISTQRGERLFTGKRVG